MGLSDADVLIPGHYFCDVIFSGMPRFPTLGTEIYCEGLDITPGGALNTVRALQRLGLRVVWAGALGNDFFSRQVQEWARDEGIDLMRARRLERPLRRVTVSLTQGSERAFLSFVDAAPDLIGLTCEQLAQTHFRHLHFGGLLVDERLPALLREWRARGVELSMDCQYREQTLAEPLLREILSGIDIFLPNADEARRLCGTDSLEEAAATLTQLVPTLAIKEGACGARLWAEGRWWHAPAPVVEPLDTTGAGDVFNAAFLAARLAGQPPRECLRQGVVAGSLSTLGYGSSAAPTSRELRIALATDA